MSSDLAAFWQMAAADLPLVIVGGGRWGRTWASVIAAARGSGRGITIAARSDPDAVRAWAAVRHELAGISIAATLGQAVESGTRPAVAIVASRPRDHVRDAREALRLGLDVLVEKPISVDARGGRSLLAAAQDAGRVVAAATEFAYLPALHQLAIEVSRREGSLRYFLNWNDAAGEVRHGAVKVRHEEAGLLTDLLPHAFSIFQAFAPGAAWRMVDATESEDGSLGRIEFVDGIGGRYEFLCNVAAGGRQRILEIEGDAFKATLDFATATPSVLVDGQMRAPVPQHAVMTSTLRLELGAFLMATTGAVGETFIVAGVPSLLRLQEQLEQILVGKSTVGAVAKIEPGRS
jgi:predicted dehydrogenase